MIYRSTERPGWAATATAKQQGDWTRVPSATKAKSTRAHPLWRCRLLQLLLRRAVLAGLRAKTGRAGLHGAPALLLAAKALHGLVRRLLRLLRLHLLLGVAGVARVISALLLLVCCLHRCTPFCKTH